MVSMACIDFMLLVIRHRHWGLNKEKRRETITESSQTHALFIINLFMLMNGTVFLSLLNPRSGQCPYKESIGSKRYIYIHIYIYTYVYVHIYVHIYMYIYIIYILYIYIHIYIYMYNVHISCFTFACANDPRGDALEIAYLYAIYIYIYFSR
jgi:hypothetical protein